MGRSLYQKVKIDLNMTNRLFILFCGFHLLIWTLLPTFVYQNPPTDSLEGLAWGRLWLWGYEKHPFLAPWLTAFFTDTFGAVGWPIYLLSQLCVITCFWGTFQLAKKFLKPLLALVSVLMLEGITYYNLSSPVFDPNVLMLPLWAWISYFAYYYFFDINNKLVWTLGLFIGLSLVTKYESAILIIILILFVLSLEKKRDFILNRKFLFMILSANIIVFPNIMWLYHHHFNAVFYAVDELNQSAASPSLLKIIFQRIYEPIKFIFEQVGNALGFFILFFSLNFKSTQKQGNHELKVDEKEKMRFLSFIALGPTVFTIIFSCITGSHLVSRWAFPFYSNIGIYFLKKYESSLLFENIRRFRFTFFFLNAILIIGMILYFLIVPYLFKRNYHSDSFPGQNIANYVTTRWHEKFNSKLPYIAGDHHVVVNISSFSNDHPVPFFNWDPQQSPWVITKNFISAGSVFILWLKDGEQKDEIKLLHQQYPALRNDEYKEFSRLINGNKAEKIKLWIAYLPSATSL